MPSTLERLCFLNPDPGGPDLPQDALCSTSPKRRPQPKSAPQRAGLQVQTTNGGSLGISFRSTRSIFTYLGRVAHITIETGKSPVPLLSGKPDPTSGQPRMMPLFNIVKDQPKPTDLVSVRYRNSTYSIPKDDNSAAAEVLNLLDELVKLSKSVNAIPPTGTVVLH
jgi:hypothetical protein